MPRAFWAGLATTATILTAAVIPSTPAVASAREGVMYGAPDVGACYLVEGFGGRRHHTTGREPVSCAKRHNLWVLGVRLVPARAPLLRLKESGRSTRFWSFATRMCHRSWTHRLGRLDERFGLSAYALQVLLPTAEQIRHGARWVSCDLGIATPTGMLENRMHEPPRLTRHLPNRLRLCGTAAYAMTTCAGPHAYRAGVHSTVIRATSQEDATNQTYTFCSRHQPGYRMYEWRSVRSRQQGRSVYVVTCLGTRGG